MFAYNAQDPKLDTCSTHWKMSKRMKKRKKEEEGMGEEEEEKKENKKMKRREEERDWGKRGEPAVERRKYNKAWCAENDAKRISQEGRLCHLSHLLIGCGGGGAEEGK